MGSHLSAPQNRKFCDEIFQDNRIDLSRADDIANTKNTATVSANNQRTALEDVHVNSSLPDQPGHTFTLVADGHGGKAVARFIKENFLTTYTNTPSYLQAVADVQAARQRACARTKMGVVATPPPLNPGLLAKAGEECCLELDLMLIEEMKRNGVSLEEYFHLNALGTMYPIPLNSPPADVSGSANIQVDKIKEKTNAAWVRTWNDAHEAYWYTNHLLRKATWDKPKEVEFLPSAGTLSPREKRVFRREWRRTFLNLNMLSVNDFVLNHIAKLNVLNTIANECAMPMNSWGETIAFLKKPRWFLIRGPESLSEHHKCRILRDVYVQNYCRMRTLLTESQINAINDVYSLFLKNLKEETKKYDGSCGAAMAVCITTPTHYVNFWVGDVRIMLMRNNNLVNMSQDHSLRDSKERERYQLAGMHRGSVIDSTKHRNRLAGPNFKSSINMSRSIGDHYFKRSCTTPENSAKYQKKIKSSTSAFMTQEERDLLRSLQSLKSFSQWQPGNPPGALLPSERIIEVRDTIQHQIHILTEALTNKYIYDNDLSHRFCYVPRGNCSPDNVSQNVEGVYERFNVIDANGQKTNPMVHLTENGRLPEEWYKNYELTPEAHDARIKYQLRQLYKYNDNNRNYLDKHWGNKIEGSFLTNLDQLIKAAEDINLLYVNKPDYNPMYIDREHKIERGREWREWDHPVAPIVELLLRETNTPVSYIMINQIPTFTRTIHPFDAGMSCKPGISIWERPGAAELPSYVSSYVSGYFPENYWPTKPITATATDKDILIVNCCDGVTGGFKNEQLTSALLMCIDEPHEVWKRRYGYSPQKFCLDNSLYPIDICRYIVDEIINYSGVRDNVTITVNALKPLLPETRLCEKARAILTWSSQEIASNIYKIAKTDTVLFLGDATAERPCNVALTGEQLAMCGDFNNFMKFILPHEFDNKLCSDKYTIMEKIQKINEYRELIRYAYQHKTTIKSSFKPNEEFQSTLIAMLSPTDSVDKINELLKMHYDEYASIFKTLTTAGGRRKAHKAIMQILEGNF